MSAEPFLMLTTQDVAKQLGVHEMTVYRWFKRKEIPGFKIGGRWRTRQDLLNKHFEELARTK